MLTFKQRYKPRTTREYTKNDLAVYDSAGNTALNALTVYGKSEVVDGVIKSAGEGYAVVRLADLTWSAATNNRFIATPPNCYHVPTQSTLPPALLSNNKYEPKTPGGYNTVNYSFYISVDGTIGIKDIDYTTVSDFVTSLGNVMLCYQLADPSQGNTIAVKTDNGTGVDGTMAVFETGTPLYGISDTIRDVMTWDGSAGTVTKNCGEVDLGTLAWSYSPTYAVFTAALQDLKYVSGNSNNVLCPLYTISPSQSASYAPDMSIYTRSSEGVAGIGIKNSNYISSTDFKTAMSGVMLVYELEAPTREPLTSAENESIASLRAFDGTTHFTNNATTDMTVNYTIKVPTIS